LLPRQHARHEAVIPSASSTWENPMSFAQISFRRAVAGALLLAAAGMAQAQDTGYLMLGGGRSDFNVDCTGTSSCDTSGSAFQVVGGYRLGGGWAFEGLYANFGKTTATAGGIGVDIKATALGAGAAYIADLGSGFGATLRLGLASVEMKGNARVGGAGGSVSDSKAQLYAGLGLSYAFSKSISTELGYLSTRGEIVGEKGNISALTLSVNFAF
jgi:OmpA-OmpF porin, OOP family